MATVPELERHCGSWICTSPAGEVREVFTRKTAEILARYGWRVQTAAAYLAEFNQKVKTRNTRKTVNISTCRKKSVSPGQTAIRRKRQC